MAFCPTCGAEYRRGLIRCPECNIALVEELQDVGFEEDELEVVRKCGPTEAQMIEELFRNNGIDCTLQGDVTAVTFPAAGSLDEVRVWVKKQDAAKAREFLDAFFTAVEKDELREGREDRGASEDEE